MLTNGGVPTSNKCGPSHKLCSSWWPYFRWEWCTCLHLLYSGGVAAKIEYEMGIGSLWA